ncbi:MAG: efflux RND transporter periplasmic adaptor subunit [Chloroflexi bacterium]|nr:efflux RND transporter periplasmic adaptor subunit [Chloroflexota bacterium]
MNKLLLFLLAAGVLLAACQAAPSASPTVSADELPLVMGDTRLMVEGKLTPREFVNLSFSQGGKIVEVLVEEGQAVETGQVIARLDQGERLAAAVADAELAVVDARQVLQKLNENSAVTTAAALLKVADARDAVRDAERYRNNLIEGSRATDIDSARADVVILKDRLDKAQEDYASYEGKSEESVKRAEYLSKLADAQQRYDDAVRYLNNLTGVPSDIDTAIADADLFLAQAQLALAEAEYEDVAAGPDPDDLEAAQARLAAAEAALIAAQAALADVELTAPFSGLIVKLDLKPGEQALPGKTAVILADFSQWKVETEDLNEMEIPRVQNGQAVTIIPDAFPDLELAGEVVLISQLYEEKFGDITYKARIVLQDGDPRLRWGMTVTVRFEP